MCQWSKTVKTKGYLCSNTSILHIRMSTEQQLLLQSSKVNFSQLSTKHSHSLTHRLSLMKKTVCGRGGQGKPGVVHAGEGEAVEDSKC